MGTDFSAQYKRNPRRTIIIIASAIGVQETTCSLDRLSPDHAE
jgi:hypothetical protein